MNASNIARAPVHVTCRNWPPGHVLIELIEEFVLLCSLPFAPSKWVALEKARALLIHTSLCIIIQLAESLAKCPLNVVVFNSVAI